jgi:hypothetical protein
MRKKSPPSRRQVRSALFVVLSSLARSAAAGRTVGEKKRTLRARPLLGFVVTTAVALTVCAGAGAAETRTAISQMFTNPCTGEMFVAQGTLTMRSDFRVGSDGRLHETFHFNLHGTTAKGVITGAKYVVQEQVNQGINADADAAPSTQHHIFKQHYVRAGETGELLEEDDFYLWFHIHLTINSNGVPTSMKLETAEDVCR